MPKIGPQRRVPNTSPIRESPRPVIKGNRGFPSLTRSGPEWLSLVTNSNNGKPQKNKAKPPEKKRKGASKRSTRPKIAKELAPVTPITQEDQMARTIAEFRKTAQIRKVLPYRNADNRGIKLQLIMTADSHSSRHQNIHEFEKSNPALVNRFKQEIVDAKLATLDENNRLQLTGPGHLVRHTLVTIGQFGPKREKIPWEGDKVRTTVPFEIDTIPFSDENPTHSLLVEQGLAKKTDSELALTPTGIKVHSIMTYLGLTRPIAKEIPPAKRAEIMSLAHEPKSQPRLFARIGNAVRAGWREFRRGN